MAKIYIQATPVNGFGTAVASHITLILDKEDGTYRLISAGPAIAFHVNPLNQGDIIGTVDASFSPWSPEGNSHLIDIGDRDADEIWDLMVKHARQILDHKFHYVFLTRNSNSFANTLLRLVGIDLSKNIPANTYGAGFIASDEWLDFDFALTGTSGDDIIVANPNPYPIGEPDALINLYTKQTLYGLGGNDRLSGGAGNDRLDGGEGSDTVRGEGDDDLIIANLDGVNDTYDGGYGTDAIVYKWETGNSTIVLQAPNSADANGFGLSIVNAADAAGLKRGFGNDTLVSIEKAAIEAGSGADALALASDGVGLDEAMIDYIDLGSQAAGQFDTITFATWDKAVTVDLSKDIVSWTTPRTLLDFELPSLLDKTHTVTVRGAEAVIGGKGADTITGGNSDTTKFFLDGGDGADTLTLQHGSAGSVLIGGAGRDRLESHVAGSVIYGDVQNATGSAGSSDLNPHRRDFLPPQKLWLGGKADALDDACRSE